MLKKKTASVGCLTAILFFICLWAGFSYYRDNFGGQSVVEEPVIQWFQAVEKCKARYAKVPQYKGAKIPNCRRRIEDKDEFVFYWTRSVPITTKDKNDKDVRNKGVCAVSKANGKIIFLTLGKKTLVKRIKK